MHSSQITPTAPCHAAICPCFNLLHPSYSFLQQPVHSNHSTTSNATTNTTTTSARDNPTNSLTCCPTHNRPLPNSVPHGWTICHPAYIQLGHMSPGNSADILSHLSRAHREQSASSSANHAGATSPPQEQTPQSVHYSPHLASQRMIDAAAHVYGSHPQLLVACNDVTCPHHYTSLPSSARVPSPRRRGWHAAYQGIDTARNGNASAQVPNHMVSGANRRNWMAPSVIPQHSSMPNMHGNNNALSVPAYSLPQMQLGSALQHHHHHHVPYSSAANHHHRHHQKLPRWIILDAT